MGDGAPHHTVKAGGPRVRAGISLEFQRPLRRLVDVVGQRLPQ